MKAKPIIPVVFQPGERLVRASQGMSILETALAAKIDISHSCGGNGTCGTCRVFIENAPPELSPRNEIEIEFAEDRGFAENERLGCQTLVVPGLVIKVLNAGSED